MNKKIIILAVAAIVGVVAMGAIINTKKYSGVENVRNSIQNESSSVSSLSESKKEKQSIKEFSMESFVEFVDGKPKPQFSVKEIVINRGDLIRIKVATISGNHNFKIDEFDIYADTPVGQEITVEFTADKAGEFVYYCSQPGHRQAGHWGMLIVAEQ